MFRLSIYHRSDFWDCCQGAAKDKQDLRPLYSPALSGVEGSLAQHYTTTHEEDT